MNKAISGSKPRYEILDGLFLHRLKLRTLIALAVIAALLVVNVCLNIDIFGVLDVRNYAAYTVIGGWSLTPDLLLLYHRDWFGIRLDEALRYSGTPTARRQIP